MKKFPRIHSLSTLGLIHHQEFDYKFHPFRTDFIGESGSGKSMIADLIQLIFVGSDAFESATKATGDRPPSGMVLESALGNNIGYAFLNIETSENRYLVIGSYIESGSRSTQSFIVQAGYDFSMIVHLSDPLSFSNFIKDEVLLPIDVLKEHIASQNFFCESWHKPKKYHEILYKENILPLNLAASDKILKDYASILQSFSRGKSLNTQKRGSLQHFLFGNDSAKEIMEKFQRAVRDMENTIGEYGNNLKEIERVTQKQNALLNLKQQKDERDRVQLKWLTMAFRFWNHRTEIITAELRHNAQVFASSYNYFRILKELMQTTINEKKLLFPELEIQKKLAENKFGEVLPKHQKAEIVKGWLETFQCDINELKNRYSENRVFKRLRVLLDESTNKLNQAGAYDMLEVISSQKSIVDFTKYLSDEQERTRKSIEEKELLQNYADINNVESLAYWAFQQKRIFTIEEESVILRFQELPRIKTPDKKDYLPNPTELFADLQILDDDKSGFWVNLKGVRKFIPLIATQILNTNDEAKIRSYFNNYSANIREEITILKRYLQKLKRVDDIFSAFEDPSGVLDALKQRGKLEAFKVDASLDISEEAFSEHVNSFEQKADIEYDFDNAKEKLHETAAEVTLAKQLVSDIEKQLSQIGIIQELDTHLTQIILEYASGYSFDESTYEFELINVSSELKKAGDKSEFFRTNISSSRTNIQKGAELNQLKLSLDEAKKELNKSIEAYVKWYDVPPQVGETGEFVAEPKDEERSYLAAEAAYFSQYKNVIEHYIPSESFRLNQNEDFVGLAKSLLPEAFHEGIFENSENGIIETIANYLIRINDKNRQLNNRKVQKIKDLLDDVDIAITKQLDVVRRIDNFLKSRGSITGGHKARLKKEFVAAYPRSWMEVFRQTLEDEVGNSSNLSNKLSEKIDLEQMMKAAFHHCGGAPTAGMSIYTLLDPFTYYDLYFTMESESGRVNKGSTGQTYAAIALLCIARLSVMSQEEGDLLQPAVRIMPIDEAEGLGSNYDMLYDIANEYDYQIISLSIGPVGKFREGEQYIYILHKNMDIEEPINYVPMAILCEKHLSRKVNA